MSKDISTAAGLQFNDKQPIVVEGFNAAGHPIPLDHEPEKDDEQLEPEDHLSQPSNDEHVPQIAAGHPEPQPQIPVPEEVHSNEAAEEHQPEHKEEEQCSEQSTQNEFEDATVEEVGYCQNCLSTRLQIVYNDRCYKCFISFTEETRSPLKKYTSSIGAAILAYIITMVLLTFSD